MRALGAFTGRWGIFGVHSLIVSVVDGAGGFCFLLLLFELVLEVGNDFWGFG